MVSAATLGGKHVVLISAEVDATVSGPQNAECATLVAPVLRRVRRRLR